MKLKTLLRLFDRPKSLQEFRERLDNPNTPDVTKTKYTLNSFYILVLMWLGTFIYLYATKNHKIEGFLAITPLLGIPILIATTVALLKERKSNRILNIVSRTLLLFIGAFFALAATFLAYFLIVRFNIEMLVLIVIVNSILIKLAIIYIKRAITGNVREE